MKDLAVRNRRTAVLTFAGIGFFHLVAFGVVMGLMGAGRNAADREVPQRPPLVAAQSASLATTAPRSETALARPTDTLEAQWVTSHKDTRGPWTFDARGEIRWR